MSQQKFWCISVIVLGTAATFIASAQDRTRPAVVAEPSSRFSPAILRLDQAADASGALASVSGADADADFLRLRLLVVAPTAISNVSLIVSDNAGQPVDTINLTEIVGVREIWSHIIPGQKFSIRANGRTQAAGSSVTVWQLFKNVTPPEALSIVDGKDDREPFANVTDPKLRAAGRAVVKLLFQVGERMYSCTGFLVKPNQVLTNEHCVATAPVCATTVVLLDYDTVTMVPAARQRRCNAIRDADHSLDYSELELDSPVDASIQPLTFAAHSPAAGEALIVIEHPGGAPKQISRVICKAVSNPVRGNAKDTDFTHTCATLNGSSGSPVLDASMQVVGVHHFGIGDDEPTYNRAVRIERISQSLAGRGLLP